MDWRIGRLGDAALLVELDGGVDAATNARVHDLARAIAARRGTWVRDIVPAYSSIAVFVDRDAFAADVDALAEAERWLCNVIAAPTAGTARSEPRRVEIPVCYGGGDGPDLDRVADLAGLSPDEVIARHTSCDYTVAMLGFAPGFPYLLGLDPRLATPRLDTPRTQVPAGSVAIGGAQTGLYPRPGPGGWNLIGRTELVVFDAGRDPPALLAPGDRVRFVAVDRP